MIVLMKRPRGRAWDCKEFSNGTQVLKSRCHVPLGG